MGIERLNSTLKHTQLISINLEHPLQNKTDYNSCLTLSHLQLSHTTHGGGNPPGGLQSLSSPLLSFTHTLYNQTMTYLLIHRMSRHSPPQTQSTSTSPFKPTEIHVGLGPLFGVSEGSMLHESRFLLNRALDVELGDDGGIYRLVGDGKDGVWWSRWMAGSGYGCVWLGSIGFFFFF